MSTLYSIRACLPPMNDGSEAPLFALGAASLTSGLRTGSRAQSRIERGKGRSPKIDGSASFLFPPPPLAENEGEAEAEAFLSEGRRGRRFVARESNVLFSSSPSLTLFFSPPPYLGDKVTEAKEKEEEEEEESLGVPGDFLTRRGRAAKGRRPCRQSFDKRSRTFYLRPSLHSSFSSPLMSPKPLHIVFFSTENRVHSNHTHNGTALA